MKLLSWDVGIYNLSYCLLDENNKIIDWNIVNLMDDKMNKKNRTELFENIPKKLNEIAILLEANIVIIENQPSLKNPQMKSIQMILYSYFLIYGKIIHKKINSIDFCSASNKLKIYDGPPIVLEIKKRNKKEETIKDEIIKDEIIKDEIIKEEIMKEEENKKGKKKEKIKYGDKKKLAIEYTKYFLKKQNEEFFHDFFLNHKKKDDLADSYLQGLYYLKANKIE